MHTKSLHKDVCIIIFTELYEAYKNFPTFLESADSLDKLLNFLQFSSYFSLFSYFSTLLFQSGTRFIMRILGIFAYSLSQFMCVFQVKNKLEHMFSRKYNTFRRA